MTTLNGTKVDFLGVVAVMVDNLMKFSDQIGTNNTIILRGEK